MITPAIRVVGSIQQYVLNRPAHVRLPALRQSGRDRY
jgi:hypothetical protein